MQTIYLNVRNHYGVETVDEFTQGDSAPANFRDFKKYVNEMEVFYHYSNCPVYQSRRPCKEWEKSK